MQPCAMKVQQNGHKCYTIFSHSQVQYKLCGLISDYY